MRPANAAFQGGDGRVPRATAVIRSRGANARALSSTFRRFGFQQAAAIANCAVLATVPPYQSTIHRSPFNSRWNFGAQREFDGICTLKLTRAYERALVSAC